MSQRPRDDDSAKMRARARLALRAERAFGLNSLPASPHSTDHLPQAEPSASGECRTSDPETPVKPAAAACATQATAPANDLFGRAVVSPAAPPPRGGLLPTLQPQMAFASPPLTT